MADERIELLDRITEEVRKAEAAGTPDSEASERIGKMVAEFRNRLGLSPTQFAQQLGVSVQTVHRWEKAPPPLHQITRFRSLILERSVFGSPEVREAPRGYALIDDKKVGVRPLSYLLDRELDAEEIWIIRSMSYFLSGWEGPARRWMTEHLMRSRVNYYFVFRHAEKPEDWGWPARTSFARFKQSLFEKQRVLGRDDLAPRAHGLEIKEQQTMTDLGLSQTYAATVILRYAEATQDLLKRSFDIFVETPVAVYDDPESFSRLQEGDLLWTELPPKRAGILWEQWTPLLNKLRDSAEILVQEKDLKGFDFGKIIDY